MWPQIRQDFCQITKSSGWPVYVSSGEPAGSGISWLAEVVTALLQQAQEVGLCEAKAQGSRSSEGLAVPEGAAWRDCFAAFLDLILRHLKTLCEVCRLAQEVNLWAFHFLMSCSLTALQSLHLSKTYQSFLPFLFEAYYQWSQSPFHAASQARQMSCQEPGSTSWNRNHPVGGCLGSCAICQTNRANRPDKGFTAARFRSPEGANQSNAHSTVDRTVSKRFDSPVPKGFKGSA